MDTLLLELLLSIICQLPKKSINWAFVCIDLYKLYINRRDSNKLVAKRFERVTNKFNECNENQTIGVVFDRMIYIHQYLNTTSLAILVKSYFPKHITKENIIISVHYTMDEWKNVNSKVLHLENINNRENVWESTWCTFINLGLWEHDPIWFTIELIYKGKVINENNLNDYWLRDPISGPPENGMYHDQVCAHSTNLWNYVVEKLWDNNGGWNYSTNKEYEQIPDLLDEKYYICSDYALLNRWVVGGKDEDYYIDMDYIKVNPFDKLEACTQALIFLGFISPDLKYAN